MIRDSSNRGKENGELAEKALAIYWAHRGEKGAMLAAINAIAPMLIAQGMREAIAMVGPYDRADYFAEIVIARAQELDPK